jgi:hypothetical protein
MSDCKHEWRYDENADRSGWHRQCKLCGVTEFAPFDDRVIPAQTAPSVKEPLSCPFCGFEELEIGPIDHIRADGTLRRTEFVRCCTCNVQTDRKLWNSRHHISRPAKEAMGVRAFANWLYEELGQQWKLSRPDPKIEAAITAYGNARARGALKKALEECDEDYIVGAQDCIDAIRALMEKEG